MGKKTASVFVHLGKIGMVRNNDINRKSKKKIIYYNILGIYIIIFMLFESKIIF